MILKKRKKGPALVGIVDFSCVISVVIARLILDFGIIFESILSCFDVARLIVSAFKSTASQVSLRRGGWHFAL
jgi:hypothetical protein